MTWRFTQVVARLKRCKKQAKGKGRKTKGEHPESCAFVFCTSPCVLPMKIFIAIIVLLIIHLQYRIWLGDGSIAQIDAYQHRLDDLKAQVEEKRERNEALYAEVLDLRKGQEAIEERARDELGMIKEDETFFHVLD